MTERKTTTELPIFVSWYDFICWLLPVTAKFPRRVHFTLADRIDRFALDVIEDLVDARYTRQREVALRRANLKLEKLRILLRLSKELAFLSIGQYEFACRKVDAVGRMMGGWVKTSSRDGE